ncbi:hypothetical protein MAC3UK_0038 [Bdellovibrio phage MAC3UK]|nr:hypothetical protein MAC3UK_0038 [Bdellovibrio phage MAC3UK]
MSKSKFIADLQDLLNANGASPALVTDGLMGPKTKKALDAALAGKLVKAADLPKIPAKAPVTTLGYFGAPWVGANIDLLGRYETDKDLIARYEPEWKNCGLSGYKGLAGTPRAWCALKENADRRKVKSETTNSAAASSFSRLGVKCPFWFGACLDIKHKSGSRHVCTFLYWIDEKKQIAATIDGNRNNQFGVFATDLSGKGDVLVAGPRWPKDWADGQFVSKADVLKQYPFLAVGSTNVGGSTR